MMRNNTLIVVRSMALWIGMILQVLYVNWVGQKIIDTSGKTSNSA